MKVLFYANCQNWSIRYFLSLHYKNIEYDEIPSYQFVDYEQPINEEQLKWPDLFIYQEMPEKYGIRSTSVNIKDNILTRLSDKCQKISIPYLYNPVSWITFPPAPGDGNVGDWGNTTRYLNSGAVLKYKKIGYSIEQILDLYSKGMMDFEIQNRVDAYHKALDYRDKTLDVKTSDFVKEHFRNYQLFFTQNHPTSIIAGHMANQIFKIMGDPHEVNPFKHPLTVTHIHGGSYTHSIYDKEYWKFQYPANYSMEMFIPIIREIYDYND